MNVLCFDMTIVLCVYGFLSNMNVCGLSTKSAAFSAILSDGGWQYVRLKKIYCKKIGFVTFEGKKILSQMVSVGIFGGIIFSYHKIQYLNRGGVA